MAAREYYDDNGVKSPYGGQGEYSGSAPAPYGQSPVPYGASRPAPFGAPAANPNDPYGYPTVPTYQQGYSAKAPPPLGPPLSPHQHSGYSSPLLSPGYVPRDSSPNSPASGTAGSDFDHNEGATDRGLGSALLGGSGGGLLGGKLGAVVGAVAGAALANVASHKSKDHKKKKEKKENHHHTKHGHEHRSKSRSHSRSHSRTHSRTHSRSHSRSRSRRHSSPGSIGGSGSDSGRSGHHGHTKKRFVFGYSTGGGSVFGSGRRRKSRGGLSDSD